MAETQEVSIDTLPMNEYKEARKSGLLAVATKQPEEQDVVEAESTDEGKEEAEGRPKGKGGFQKRIDKLIKQTSTLQEQLAVERKARQELEEKHKPAPSADSPKESDFQNTADFIRAQAKWEVRQELKAQQEADAKAEQEAVTKEIFHSYNERLKEARGRIEDFDETLSESTADIHQGVLNAIMEMENGPEVAYFLAKNPEVCGELREMTPLKAIGETWKISEKLGTAEEAEEEVEKPASKAPAPILPVGRGSTKSSVRLDQMSMSEYKKARAAGRIR